MKAVLLAGGAGTRMGEFTKLVSNKHLMPIYDGKTNTPMILHPIKTLVDAGITKICIVTGGRHKGAVLDFLGDGKQYGIEDISYEFQLKEGGIAQALSLAKGFVSGENCTVILGDNYYEPFDLKSKVKKFDQECLPTVKIPIRSGASQQNKKELLNLWKDGLSKTHQSWKIEGDYFVLENESPKANIFITKVEDPERFGVVEFANETAGTIRKLIEKPKIPPSNWAVTGLYMYDHHVWDYIENIKPSGRGELEITDVNQHYCSVGGLQAYKLDTYWSDMGTPQSISSICAYLAKKQH